MKAVTEVMGHASVRQSFDRYGHLLRDSHANKVSKLDALLMASDTESRVVQLKEPLGASDPGSTSPIPYHAWDGNYGTGRVEHQCRLQSCTKL